jgi:hypothetical protein
MSPTDPRSRRDRSPGPPDKSGGGGRSPGGGSRRLLTPYDVADEARGPPVLGENERFGLLLPGGRRAAIRSARTCHECGREYDWAGFEDEGAQYCCEACCLGEMCTCGE